MQHGVRNERFLFALVMLAEWHLRFFQRTATLRARIEEAAPRYGRS